LHASRISPESGRTRPLRAATASLLDFDLLRNLQGVIDLDAEVPEMFSSTFEILSAESCYVLECG